MNVQHPSKGRNTRNPSAFPITSTEDSNLHWLSEMVSWLKRANAREKSPQEGFLTQDTYTAVLHTTSTLIEVCKYLLTELEFDFVLLGKFQTDGLEGRFGQYRQLSGGNSLVSVQQVLESEKNFD